MPQPPFKVTKRLKHKVMLLIATGLGERGIAHELEIDRKTLREHFAYELEVGKSKIVAKLHDMLWMAASNGSVAAMNRLLEKANGQGIRSLPNIGKKEQQLEDAKNAGGGEWGDLLRVVPIVDGDKPN
jgi:hypothetical protein